MKQQSTLIVCYAILLLIGGFIGFITAGSIPSLVMSGIFSLLLVACSIYMFKGCRMAFHFASALVLILLLFFGYRFFMSLKLMPGGIMMLISAGLLIYLANCCPLLNKMK